jgi:hypothetical protein
MKAGERSEVDVMVREQGEEVLGFKIKPWTLGQIIALSPVLDLIKKNFQARGITFDNFDQVLALISSWALSLARMISTEKDTTEVIETPVDGPSILDLAQGFMPAMPDILAISLKLEQAEVNDMDGIKAAYIGVKVIQLNVTSIKNFFSQEIGTEEPSLAMTPKTSS